MLQWFNEILHTHSTAKKIGGDDKYCVVLSAARPPGRFPADFLPESSRYYVECMNNSLLMSNLLKMMADNVSSTHSVDFSKSAHF